MFFSAELVAKAAFVFLFEYELCMGYVQNTHTNFTRGKIVATSYMTLQLYSKIKCVQKCLDEKRQNRCNVAGYNVATRSCFLSNGDEHDLLDTADEAFGVFFFPGIQFIEA